MWVGGVRGQSSCEVQSIIESWVFVALMRSRRHFKQPDKQSCFDWIQNRITAVGQMLFTLAAARSSRTLLRIRALALLSVIRLAATPAVRGPRIQTCSRLVAPTVNGPRGL